MAELALRCYRAEQGRAPSGLNELVPNYLHAIPSDPFSGAPLIYRPQGTNWLLYSIGVDSASVKSGTSATNGGMFYDSQP